MSEYAVLMKEAKTNFFGNVKIPSEDFYWLFTLKNSSLWEEYRAFKGSGPASKIAFASLEPGYVN